jgi:hypothetical protein
MLERPNFGIDSVQPEDRWPADIGSHAHYAKWNLAGPKAHFEIGALWSSWWPPMPAHCASHNGPHQPFG